jgi:hypothetical protein
MIKEITKNHRKKKSFYAAYLGGILSVLSISFFCLYLNFCAFIISIICWGAFAIIGCYFQKDTISKREFKLGYFISTISSILVSLLFLFENIILLKWYHAIIILLLIVLSYFPLNWLYVKIWKEE